MNSVPWEAIDGVPTYKLFIDGQWVQSSRNSVVEDFNPSTGKLYARMQQAGPEEIERAIASAYRAKDDWGASMVT
jgi:acyl-CoA reductase-like NAD-dependent aldehyde dehydrogenase